MKRLLGFLRLEHLLPLMLAALSVALVLGQLENYRALPSFHRQVAEVGILTLGMTAVIVTGGIDLSVAATMALSATALGLSAPALGPVGASAVALVTGLACGSLNGLLVRFGIAPLVVTLGTMALYSGLSMTLTNGQRISDLPEAFGDFGRWQSGGPIPLAAHLAVWAAASLVMGWLLHASVFGRELFAIGENPRAATAAGVRVPVRRAAAHALLGLLAGLVAVLNVTRTQSVSPGPEAGLELKVIACVILGGTPVTGGAGSIVRTVLGTIALTHLERALRLAGGGEFIIPILGRPLTLSNDLQLVLIGIATILIAGWNERRTQGSR
jgi:ribose/xylose/arabinose/galactoside ABC-type transport system permease subunit